MNIKNNITELNALFKQVMKDMPAEYKRTMVLGCSSIGIGIASLALPGAAKKIAACIGIATYGATIISALDANKKMLTSIGETSNQINENWEAYKATHPEIFGNN